jgi:YD repeat-containing protein
LKCPSTPRPTYDQSGAGFSHGAGRLTSSTYPEGSAQFAYDAQGRLTPDTRRLQPAAGANASVLTHTVGYGYTAAGQISQIVYPSGRVVHYTYTQGQLSGIGLAAQTGASVVPLVSDRHIPPTPGRG